METTQNNRIPTNTNEAIALFYTKIVAADGQRFKRFTLNDVVNFVSQYNFGTTKGTIDRALRVLRKRGTLNYGVANRKLGIFQAKPLEEAQVGK